MNARQRREKYLPAGGGKGSLQLPISEHIERFERLKRLERPPELRLAECDFIKRSENIIITGTTGIGKSFLASAIGHQACSIGYNVLYQHSTKLFAKLNLAKANGSYVREPAKMERRHLIIDDF